MEALGSGLQRKTNNTDVGVPGSVRPTLSKICSLECYAVTRLTPAEIIRDSRGEIVGSTFGHRARLNLDLLHREAHRRSVVGKVGIRRVLGGGCAFSDHCPCRSRHLHDHSYRPRRVRSHGAVFIADILPVPDTAARSRYLTPAFPRYGCSPALCLPAPLCSVLREPRYQAPGSTPGMHR